MKRSRPRPETRDAPEQARTQIGTEIRTEIATEIRTHAVNPAPSVRAADTVSAIVTGRSKRYDAPSSARVGANSLMQSATPLHAKIGDWKK